MSEDCLTINVVRPAGLNSTAKLPVLVWIYGGSFLEGGSPIFNPTILVGQSMRMVRWSLLHNSIFQFLPHCTIYIFRLGRARYICLF